MLDTDPTATVDELEHDLADLDEVEPPRAHRTAARLRRRRRRPPRRSRWRSRRRSRSRPRSATSTPSRSTGSAPTRCRRSPLPFLKRKVYGRYRSSGTPYQIELRVDVDGPSPTMRISADYYAIAGATVSYFGSMRVDAPAVAITATHVVITGTARYTWAAGAPRVKVTIPRVPSRRHPPRRRCSTSGERQPGARPTSAATSARPSGRCSSSRTARTPCRDPFASYNTGSLPSGGPARTLSADHRVRRGRACSCSRRARTTSSRPRRPARTAAWSDAELHAAMVRHFSRWRDLPQWAVWLFHARLHDLGPNLYGIMFDQQGQAAAGLRRLLPGIGGTTADARRLQLYTCIHELGHCFNLLHSWQKSPATPPQPNRPASPSWMNYPWRFPGGPAAFWSGVPVPVRRPGAGAHPPRVPEGRDHGRQPVRHRGGARGPRELARAGRGPLGHPARAGSAAELRLRRAGDGRGEADLDRPRGVHPGDEAHPPAERQRRDRDRPARRPRRRVRAAAPVTA